jgi:hypothetical protein
LPRADFEAAFAFPFAPAEAFRFAGFAFAARVFT